MLTVNILDNNNIENIIYYINGVLNNHVAYMLVNNVILSSTNEIVFVIYGNNGNNIVCVK